jgi:hypothetical protein
MCGRPWCGNHNFASKLRCHRCDGAKRDFARADCSQHGQHALMKGWQQK